MGPPVQTQRLNRPHQILPRHLASQQHTLHRQHTQMSVHSMQGPLGSMQQNPQSSIQTFNPASQTPQSLPHQESRSYRLHPNIDNRPTSQLAPNHIASSSLTPMNSSPANPAGVTSSIVPNCGTSSFVPSSAIPSVNKLSNNSYSRGRGSSLPSNPIPSGHGRGGLDTNLRQSTSEPGLGRGIPLPNMPKMRMPVPNIQSKKKIDNSAKTQAEKDKNELRELRYALKKKRD